MGETADETRTPRDSSDRVFLVVVDETEEMEVALRFACRRARHTGGRVALLYVIEPAEFQHWMAVEDLMREEARVSSAVSPIGRLTCRPAPTRYGFICSGTAVSFPPRAGAWKSRESAPKR